MDDTVDGSTYSQNEVTIHVDLSGASDVEILIDLFDFNDEEHALPTGSFATAVGDGISVSDDGGTWYTSYTFGH